MDTERNGQLSVGSALPTIRQLLDGTVYQLSPAGGQWTYIPYFTILRQQRALEHCRARCERQSLWYDLCRR